MYGSSVKNQMAIADQSSGLKGIRPIANKKNTEIAGSGNTIRFQKIGQPLPAC